MIAIAQARGAETAGARFECHLRLACGAGATQGSSAACGESPRRQYRLDDSSGAEPQGGSEPMSVDDKLDKAAPHRLLALDGGGIRGVMTLEILREIERMLQTGARTRRFVRARRLLRLHRRHQHRRDHRDVPSLGWRVSSILDFYVEARARRCSIKASLLKRFRYKFEDEKLAAMLKEEIGADTTLGRRDSCRTLLLLVMRNATTDSPWPISNNPRAKYNDPARADSNLESAALAARARQHRGADLFPARDDPGRRSSRFVFVDGGVTMYNNPAFQLFLMATARAVRLVLGDRRREDAARVDRNRHEPERQCGPRCPGEMNLIYNASSIPSALMFAAANEQDFLCRVFGRTLCGDALDREVGDLIAPANPLPGGRVPGPVQPKLFTYMRYNAELTTKGSGRARPPGHRSGARAADGLGRTHQRAAEGRPRRRHAKGEERALRRIPELSVQTEPWVLASGRSPGLA